MTYESTVLAFFIILKNHMSRMKLNITSTISLVIQTFLIIIILTLFAIIFVEPANFYGFYHDLASIVVLFWLTIIEPVLFFKSLTLILEIISEDYSFNGYQKKTWIFLVIDFIIIFFLGISSVWMIVFYRDGSNFYLFSEVTVNYLNLEFFFIGVLLIVLSVFIIIIFYYAKGLLSNFEKIKIQESIIPYVFLYAILFLLIRGVSGIFTWDSSLRSIFNIIDIVFFIFILLIGINGLINLQDNDVNISKFRLTRPLNWLNGIPKYSKLLLLFFLGGMMFYYSLEQETISVLSGTPNYLATQKITAVLGTVVFGYISVFLNFSPKQVPKNHVGPIKFFFSSIQDLFQKGT